MTFTNRIGEDIYIKLNSADEPKVLHAYDSRVSFVFQPSGRDELQVSCLICRVYTTFYFFINLL
jgi:vacuolar protein sorting-associated protein 13A/C